MYNITNKYQFPNNTEIWTYKITSMMITEGETQASFVLGFYGELRSSGTGEILKKDVGDTEQQVMLKLINPEDIQKL